MLVRRTHKNDCSPKIIENLKGHKVRHQKCTRYGKKVPLNFVNP